MTSKYAAAATLALATALVQAQGPQSRAAFEVASVKRNISGDTTWRYQVPPSGTVAITNSEIRGIIRIAYQIDISIEQFTIIAPPNNALIRNGGDLFERMNTPRFDVQAKIPEGTAPGQQFEMLRSLLEDRFKLRAHKETRTVPIYALTAARPDRLGPALRRSSVDCDVFFAERAKNRDLAPPLGANNEPLCTSEYKFSPRGGLEGMRSAGTIARLTGRIQSFIDRPIVDATGLPGTFEWTLAVNLVAISDDVGLPPIFGALQEQLGLKLEPRTGPIDVLVIDSIQMPSEN